MQACVGAKVIVGAADGSGSGTAVGDDDAGPAFVSAVGPRVGAMESPAVGLPPTTGPSAAVGRKVEGEWVGATVVGFADGAAARDPRDAATGSDRERRRGAVARVCAYRERGGRSGAVQRANSRGFECRERRRICFFFRVSARDGRRFFVARPSTTHARFFRKRPCRKTVADSIFSVSSRRGRTSGGRETSPGWFERARARARS